MEMKEKRKGIYFEQSCKVLLYNVLSLIEAQCAKAML